jgi:hypothetical protein
MHLSTALPRSLSNGQAPALFPAFGGLKIAAGYELNATKELAPDFATMGWLVKVVHRNAAFSIRPLSSGGDQLTELGYDTEEGSQSPMMGQLCAGGPGARFDHVSLPQD